MSERDAALEAAIDRVGRERVFAMASAQAGEVHTRRNGYGGKLSERSKPERHQYQAAINPLQSSTPFSLKQKETSVNYDIRALYP